MSWELPAFMLAYFFSPTILGYYALAMMAVRLPMTMVGTAISQVFYQKASEEKNLTGGVQTVVQEVHTRLIAVGIFPFILFIILAEDLFTFVFGADWLTAGTYGADPCPPGSLPSLSSHQLQPCSGVLEEAEGPFCCSRS